MLFALCVQTVEVQHLPITVNMSLVPFLLKRSELPLNSDFVVQPFQESMTVGIFYVDIKLP